MPQLDLPLAPSVLSPPKPKSVYIGQTALGVPLYEEPEKRAAMRPGLLPETPTKPTGPSSFDTLVHGAKVVGSAVASAYRQLTSESEPVPPLARKQTERLTQDLTAATGVITAKAVWNIGVAEEYAKSIPEAGRERYRQYVKAILQTAKQDLAEVQAESKTINEIFQKAQGEGGRPLTNQEMVLVISSLDRASTAAGRAAKTSEESAVAARAAVIEATGIPPPVSPPTESQQQAVQIASVAASSALDIAAVAAAPELPSAAPEQSLQGLTDLIDLGKKTETSAAALPPVAAISEATEKLAEAATASTSGEKEAATKQVEAVLVSMAPPDEIRPNTTDQAVLKAMAERANVFQSPTPPSVEDLYGLFKKFFDDKFDVDARASSNMRQKTPKNVAKMNTDVMQASALLQRDKISPHDKGLLTGFLKDIAKGLGLKVKQSFYGAGEEEAPTSLFVDARGIWI